MATGLNLHVYKNLPGYKGILKVVLKSQIQMLVEQLAEQTGEESIVLSASIEDGTLTHLGSTSGNVFITSHDDFKKQFLGFCLKRHTSSAIPPSKQSQALLGPVSKNSGSSSDGKGSGIPKKKPKLAPAIENVAVKLEPDVASNHDDSASLSFPDNDGTESEDIQISEDTLVPSNASHSRTTINGVQDTRKKSIENILKRKYNNTNTELKVSFQWNKDKHNTSKNRISSKRKQTFPMQVKKPLIEIHGDESESSFQPDSPVPVNLFRSNCEDTQNQADSEPGLNRLESVESDDFVEIMLDRDEEQLSGDDSIYRNVNESSSSSVYGSGVPYQEFVPKGMKADYADISPSASPFSSPEGYNMKRGLKSEAKDGLLVSRGEGRYEKLIKCEICGKVCRTSNMARHKKRYCLRSPNIGCPGEEGNLKTFADL